MLFHHSLDSYKAPALNLHSNIFELLFFSQEYSRGTALSKNSFIHVIDELSYNLSNDPVIKLSNNIYKELQAKIRNLDNPGQFRMAVQALHAEFEHGYWEKLIQTILDLVKENREKNSILKALRSFCVEIELRGFSREYVYKKTQDFFFTEQNEPSRISNSDQLKDFLDIFKHPPKKYKVYLRAKIPVHRYNEHLHNEGITICTEQDEIITTLELSRLLKRKRQGFEGFTTYIKVDDVEAFDPYRAREMAEMHLRMFFDTYTFLDHRTTLDIYPSCVTVEDDSDGKETFLRVRPQPMEKGSIRTKVPKEKLENTFKTIFSNFTSQSTHQLFRVFDYHRAAISTDAPESQLISLWAALEGIFPIPYKGEKGMAHYLKILIPALVLSYPDKILFYTAEALKHAGKPTKVIIERDGVGKNFYEKAVYYLVAEEIGDKAKELTATLKNYPLLKHRAFWCHQHFNSAKTVHQTLESHRQRISWHLRRIYLARNQILHNDRTLPYLPTLVENLHSYLVIILRSIFKIAQRSPGNQLSIDTALELLSNHEEVYLKNLKNNDEKCNKNSFKRIIFGDANPLSPFYEIKQ